MGERTKQVLIVTAGVVLIAGGFLVYQLFRDRQAVTRISCPDGQPAFVVNPSAFLLQYSGRSVTVSLERDKLEAQLGVTDTALREADEAVQLLDARLRVSVMHQVATPCDPRGRELFARLDDYRNGEFERLVELAGQLKQVAKASDPAARAKASALVDEQRQVATAAAARVSAPTAGSGSP